MSDAEITYHIECDSLLNRVRMVLSAEIARIERATGQAGAQGRTLPQMMRHRMEFEAVEKIAAILGMKI